MYCDKCDIKILYKTNTCPLCGNEISQAKGNENTIYPKRNAGFKYPKIYSFTHVYSFIAFAVSIILLIINLIVDRDFLWSLIVAGSFVYFYVLIRHTIVSSYGSAGKIFVQGVLLSALIIIIQHITKSGSWAYDYVVPMIFTVNTLALWIVSFIRKIRRSNYIFAILGISFLNFLPSVLLVAGLSGVLWTAILTLVLGVISLLIIFLVFSKALISEIKRLLHI